MKKKLLTAFLVTALGISMLSGCGGERTVTTIQPNLNSQPKKKIRRRQIKWQS